MKPRKPLLAILAAALFIASALTPASALSALLHQGQTGTGAGVVSASFLFNDAATGQTGQDGLASTATKTVELPGATTYIPATGTLVGGGGGAYDYYPSASETATTGIVKFRFTAPNVVQADVAVQVVGFDPASSTVQLPVMPPPAYLTDTSLLAKTSDLAPLNAAIGSLPSLILLTPANKLATTATGAVRTVNSLSKYTYNPATKSLQLLGDDGTALGAPVVLTTDSAGNITSRQ